MFFTKAYVKVKNFTLRIVFVHSPWLKDIGISRKRILYWCTHSTLLLKELYDISILVPQKPLISEILVVSFNYTACLLMLWILFYYEILQQKIPIAVEQRLKKINYVQESNHLPKWQYFSLILNLLVIGISSLYDTIVIYSYPTTINVLIFMNGRLFNLLLFQWMTLFNIIRKRYSDTKEMISLLVDLPDHLQFVRSTSFTASNYDNIISYSVDLFREVRDNHGIVNRHFAFICRLTYAVCMFWLMTTSYQIWKKNILENEDKYLNVVVSLSAVLLHYPLLVILKISLDKEIEMVKIEIDKVRCFQTSTSNKIELSLFYLEMEHNSTAVTCFEFGIKSLLMVLSTLLIYPIIVAQLFYYTYNTSTLLLSAAFTWTIKLLNY